jgi:hypothetical protein
LYPCRTFTVTIENVTIGDEGEPVVRREPRTYDSAWAACDGCHLAIEDGGVIGISHRIGAFYRLADPTLEDETLFMKVVDALKYLYGEFIRHRTGKPVPMRKADS